MSTITREQLRERAREKVKSLEFAVTQTAFADSLADLEEELELARIALASLEAEAVAWRSLYYENHGLLTGSKNVLASWQKQGWKCESLYTAPPAPVSVPNEIESTSGSDYDDYYCDGWNACRAAMLQGAEPVTTAYKLGSSPEIPDGWVMVPFEPTEDMIVNGFESEPDESFSDEKEWATYDAMSGCQQAAHRAKLCWAAMIAAAPKTEHK
ncbi:hypothetical protein [Enterobacter vonholyi]|uniref:hypothetical protein n=1 Tax=Enterobacter vonholyi TaxID=2797505 RepID=UPI0032B3556A